MSNWISGRNTTTHEFEDERTSLRFVSLGIVDYGSQPWQDESKQLTLFFWGEVYGAKDSLEETASQIVACYRSDSLNELKSLNGLFSFALWDSRSQRLTLGSDIYASRPLFYHASEGAFHFASSPFAVAAAV
ncbi:MAG: hypothetical protein ABIJ61_04315, partial [bacterium]